MTLSQPVLRQGNREWGKSYWSCHKVQAPDKDSVYLSLRKLARFSGSLCSWKRWQASHDFKLLRWHRVILQCSIWQPVLILLFHTTCFPPFLINEQLLNLQSYLRRGIHGPSTSLRNITEHYSCFAIQCTVMQFTSLSSLKAENMIHELRTKFSTNVHWRSTGLLTHPRSPAAACWSL